MKTKLFLMSLICGLLLVGCGGTPYTKLSKTTKEKMDAVPAYAYDLKLMPEDMCLKYIELGEYEWNRRYGNLRVLTAGIVKDVLYFGFDSYGDESASVSIVCKWKDKMNAPWEDSDFECRFCEPDDVDLEEMTDRLRSGDEVIIIGNWFGCDVLEDCSLIYVKM